MERLIDLGSSSESNEKEVVAAAVRGAGEQEAPAALEEEVEGEKEHVEEGMMDVELPFALGYFEMMEALMQERAAKNYVSLFSMSSYVPPPGAEVDPMHTIKTESLEGDAEKKRSSSFMKKLRNTAKKVSLRSKAKKERASVSDGSVFRRRSSGAKSEETIPDLSFADMLSGQSSGTKSKPGSARDRREGKLSAASGLDLESLMRSEFERKLDYSNPGRPRYVLQGRFGRVVDEDCALTMASQDWILDPHVDGALSNTTGALFPERVVELDLLADSCTHYYGNDPVYGPVVLSFDFLASSERGALWSSEGAFRIDVPQEGSEIMTPRPLERVRSAALALGYISQGTQFREGRKLEFTEALQAFADRCKSNTMKVGVLFRKPGQPTEREMFANEHGSEAFETFLDIMGDKVPLNGWKGFAGGLDTSPENLSGEFSRFTTLSRDIAREDISLMFHVSTYLPYKATDPQQLKRKRHLFNDVVVIVFEEEAEDSTPFDPGLVKTHYVHVFIVVRHCAEGYRVCVTFKEGVLEDCPPFVPYPNLFADAQQLREWLLLKLLNMERAAFFAPAFSDKLEQARRMELSFLEDRI